MILALCLQTLLGNYSPQGDDYLIFSFTVMALSPDEVWASSCVFSFLPNPLAKVLFVVAGLDCEMGAFQVPRARIRYGKP